MAMIVPASLNFSSRGLPVVFFQNDEDQDLFVRRGLLLPGQAQVLPGSGIDLDRFPASPMPGKVRPGALFPSGPEAARGEEMRQ